MESKDPSVTRQVRVIWNGKLEITFTREVEGLTPKMMIWWLTHRKDTERYKLWHPDHIEFKVLYKPEKGHVGSVYFEKQKRAGSLEKITAVVLAVSDTTYAQLFRCAGRWLPRYTIQLFEEFEPTPTGTIVHGIQIVGSDNRVWGRFWNFITRKFLFTEKTRARQAEHGLLERENSLKILPKLYAEFADKED